MRKGMKGVYVPHLLSKYFIGRSTMIPSIPLVVVTSLAEVFFEGMEYDDTFHTFSRCDLIV
jgi:hypothetical protein